MNRITVWILLFLATSFSVHALRREVCDHYYCPDHVFASGTSKKCCSAAKVDLARPYLDLIPRPYESFEMVCPYCGALMEDEGFQYAVEYEDVEDEYLDDEEVAGTGICYVPESYWCPNECEDEDGDDPWAPRCAGGAWESGYFDEYYARYYPFFISHLKYCSANLSCRHLWPELGGVAAQANDLAYEALAPCIVSGLVDGRFNPAFYCLSDHERNCSLVIYLYFYSQYHQLFSSYSQKLWIGGDR